MNDPKDLMPDLADPVEPYPDDPAFDRWIASVAPSVNPPADTPRAELWRGIEAARATAREAQAGRVPGVTPLRRAPWRLLGAVAAALLLGMALDRMILSRTGRSPAPMVDGSAADRADPARLYRLAATQTLTQAEALLTAYRARGAAEREAVGAEQLARWSREVLGSTRLLLDSPAGSDPRLRLLLEDLELVLVQLVQLSRGPVDPSDRDHLDRALEDRDLLPRIRSVAPATVAAAATD